MRPALPLLLLGLLAAPSLARAQVDGAWFDYSNERRFTGASGAYAGWSDELVASGHYTVGSPDVDSPVHVHGTYQWRYTSPETQDSGGEDRTVEIDREGRHYVSTRTDLDELDSQDGRELVTWIYVPTTLSVGDRVQILDEMFDVRDTQVSIEIAGATRTAIQLRHEDIGERHDAYGDFDTRSTDEYWFDAATGMFLRELRTENDVGATEGAAASLDVLEEVHVTDASYAPRVGEAPPDPLLVRPHRTARAGLPYPLVALMVGVVMLVAFFVLRGRRRPSRTLELGGRTILPRRLRKGEKLVALDPGVTITFAPFLAHFAVVAERTDNAVWLAESGSLTVGLAIDDKATGVASIFAREPDVCELLRKNVGRQDFFSEVRHGNLATVIAATSATGTQMPAGAAYNVLETYEVLALDVPSSPTYDTAVVSRLAESDVGTAAVLLGTVLGEPGDAYLKASLAAGDLAYVARVDGAIVGIGLATVSGTTGRLHTLAVDPAHRNKGLGRELVRARLRAMWALGAERIVTEISSLNSASLEIARGEGFVTVGTMFLETARETASAAPSVPTVRR